MSLTIRGHATGLATVPDRWRGPLPELAVRRTLRELDGYAMVPYDLAFGGYPDLAVLTWAWLRLRSDGRAEAASYRDFAEAFGLGQLSGGALEQRFGSALSAMLAEGRWLRRTRTRDNQQQYEALVPKSVGKRYAMLRRSDIAMLRVAPPRGHKPSVTATQLADFLRWQFECGKRGWTADVLTSIAARWNVGEATLRRRRDRLAACGLLEITRRPGGRFTDLVWLKEVYDPHWATTAQPGKNDDESLDDTQITHSAEERNAVLLSPAEQAAGTRKVPATSQGSTLVEPASGLRQIAGVQGAESQGSIPPNSRGPYIRNLTGGSLTEDLTELGGATATPLTLLPRKFSDASPQAAPKQKSSSPGSGLHASRPLVSGSPRQEQGEATRRTAGRLLAQHRHLSSAPAHYVKAMVKLLTRELERGLRPGHVARALERCVVDGEVNAHCELVRLAVRQAWGDQRAGACGECGADVGEHRMGCADRAAEVDAAVDEEAAAGIQAAVLASLNSARAGGPPPQAGRHVAAAQPQQPAADPLASYLPEPPEPDWSAMDEAEVVTWLTAKMTSAIADAADRPAALQTVWRSWRSQVAPQHLELVDAAAAHLRLALDQRRAS